MGNCFLRRLHFILVRLNAAVFRSQLPPRPAIPQAPGKHISLMLNGCGRPKRLVLSSWKGCCQVVTAISPQGPLRWTNGASSNVRHSPGPESGAPSCHFPRINCKGLGANSSCPSLVPVGRTLGTAVGRRLNIMQLYLGFPHLISLLSPSLQLRGVTLAGHHSGRQSDVSRLGGVGLKEQAAPVSVIPLSGVEVHAHPEDLDLPPCVFLLPKSFKLRPIQPMPATVHRYSICSKAIVLHGTLGCPSPPPEQTLLPLQFPLSPLTPLSPLHSSEQMTDKRSISERAGVGWGWACHLNRLNNLFTLEVPIARTIRLYALHEVPQ